MKSFKLFYSKEQRKQSILVDDEDFDRIKDMGWSIVDKSVRCTMLGYNSIRLANYIMNDRYSMYDHKDRNPFNNQKSNLRKATRSQNSINQGIRSTNTSGYKGVGFYKNQKRWYASIRYRYKPIFLGCYSNPIDAARAYDKKAKELFGEFAYLNFPEPEFED